MNLCEGNPLVADYPVKRPAKQAGLSYHNVLLMLHVFQLFCPAWCRYVVKNTDDVLALTKELDNESATGKFPDDDLILNINADDPSAFDDISVDDLTMDEIIDRASHLGRLKGNNL